MHGLSRFSSTLPGDSACLALPAPSSPRHSGRPDHKSQLVDKSHLVELERLRTQVALLQVRSHILLLTCKTFRCGFLPVVAVFQEHCQTGFVQYSFL